MIHSSLISIFSPSYPPLFKPRKGYSFWISFPTATHESQTTFWSSLPSPKVFIGKWFRHTQPNRNLNSRPSLTEPARPSRDPLPCTELDFFEEVINHVESGSVSAVGTAERVYSETGCAGPKRYPGRPGRPFQLQLLESKESVPFTQATLSSGDHEQHCHRRPRIAR
jgi:hypothetical protein